MSSAFVVVPPSVIRKTDTDLNRLFPGLEIQPHHTHGELDTYFREKFGLAEHTADLTVTAYPQALKQVEKSDIFAPLPEDLPQMRQDLVEKGLKEPSPYYRIISLACAIFVYQKDLPDPPAAWGDLCQQRFHGQFLCPPADTPMPALFRSVMERHYGEAGALVADTMRADLYPLDINKAVDEKQALAGLAIPSFGRTFRNNNGAMAWPKEGAVPAPLFAFLRKDASREAQDALRYLMGVQYQTFLSKTGALCPVHPEVPLFTEMHEAGGRLLWDGWDAYRELVEISAQA